MNKVIRGFLIGCVVLILIVASSEIIIKTGTGIFSHFKNKAQTQVNNQPKTQNGTKENQQNIPAKVVRVLDGTDLYIYVNKIFSLVYEKKYAEAYNLLNPQFKQLYFPTLESFTQYADENFTSESGKKGDIEYSDMIDDNIYTCKASISDIEPQDASIPSQVYYFTVFLGEGDKYTMAFYGFISTETPNLSASAGNVKLDVTRITKFQDKLDVYVTVTNAETQPVSILDTNADNAAENIIAINSDELQDYTDNMKFDETQKGCNCYSVNPNVSNDFVIEFNILGSRKLKKICFENIQVGAEKRRAEIEIK